MSSLRKYKLCVYAIGKNEERFLDRPVDAVSQADLVVVYGTVEQLRVRLAKVFVEQLTRFDEAGNRSLSPVPAQRACTDLDERLAPGWRKRLENGWQHHKPLHPREIAKMGRHLYNRSIKLGSSPDVQEDIAANSYRDLMENMVQ